MKTLVEFIQESKFDRTKVLKTISDIAKTLDKKFINSALNDVKDDIDEQDEYVDNNTDSDLWNFIAMVAEKLKMNVDELWEQMGGSYDFADALSSL